MNDFISAFAKAAKLDDVNDAVEQWAWFSRQLCDSERQEVEDGGAESGEREGALYLQYYPVENRDN